MTPGKPRPRLWLTVHAIFLALLLSAACRAAPVSTPTPSPSPTMTPSATPAIGIALRTRAAPTAAVIQITPTPLPTPTATPTPTPIAYAIQPGDTVWVIAAQNGTTVDAILALNPDLRPELLSVGQVITLPPRPTPVFGSGARTPVPLIIETVSLHVYDTPLDTVWLLGEIVNRSTVAVANVALGFLVDDALVATVWVPDTLAPGDRAPFGVQLAGAPATVPVTVVQSADAVPPPSASLTVSAVELTATAGQATVTGTLTNEGALAAARVVVTATFYDNQGRVTGFRQQPIAETLQPDERTIFTFTSTLPGGTASRVDVTARVVGTSLATPTVTP